MMGVYVIANQKGYYIRNDVASGKYVPVRSLKYATQWEDPVKANKVLHNSITKNIRKDYSVRFVETTKAVEKNNLSVQHDICFRNISDDNVNKWLFKINAIKEMLSGSDTNRQELNERLSNIDKEIVDVEHYIEFGNFNAYQGWLCFKMLQNLLKQRRGLKDEIYILSQIEKCRFDTESLSSLSQSISDIQNKRYIPRIHPELFKVDN